MDSMTRNHDVIVIGGGQAGLAMGYYLQKQGRDFVILEGSERVGDVWRDRWDSLVLFTTAKHSGLPGMPFPAPEDHYPNKDEMADYVEAYAERFALPVRLGQWVTRLSREGDRYAVDTTDSRYTAAKVVVATGAYHVRYVPAFAADLDTGITQVHSNDYNDPGQLPPGEVLVVGAGSSGTQISLELAGAGRRVSLAGRYAGFVPERILGMNTFDFLLKTLFNVPNTSRFGKTLSKKILSKGAPVPGIREKALIEAGVTRLPRVEGTQAGRPLLADGRQMDPDAIVWATGSRYDFGWIDLPMEFDAKGKPIHTRGVVESEPGLYFLALSYQYRLKSHLLAGVGDDAEYLAEQIAAREALAAAPQRAAAEPQAA